MTGSDDTGIRIVISPEPSDEEAAAIAGVIAALLAETPDDEVPAPPVDRWALASRHEALRGPLWPIEWDGFGRQHEPDR